MVGGRANRAGRQSLIAPGDGQNLLTLRRQGDDFRTAIAGPYTAFNLFLPDLVEVRGFAHAVNVGLDKLRFLAPVVVGSRIRATSEIISADEVKGAIQSVVRVTIEIEGGDKPALVADTISRYFPE